MCGIFALLNHPPQKDDEFIRTQFNKGKGRGPEHSVFSTVCINTLFGFHRLAINGLDQESNQPLIHNDIYLICNGEIYNYHKLYEDMGIVPNTNSDCEVILHLYEKYGIEQTLQMLDGVFAFVLLDNRILKQSSETTKLYVARDPYGVRPLYYLEAGNNLHGFASEAKMLSDMRSVDKCPLGHISHFKPGHYSEYSLPQTVSPVWKHIETRSYHSTGFNSNILISNAATDEKPNVLANIQTYLISAVFKRCCTTERPIACLLSGGLDSSLITALVSEYHKIHNLPQIETYSIGLSGSDDLKYARIVADYLGTKHTEVILTEADFIAAVPDVIRSIESYDTTTVRASLGNWLLGKHIAKHSEAKVIFNGDGSDELAGGYLYMGACPDAIEYDRECRRLLKDIHQFDVLRSDKSISSHGLEPRTPFLDRSWVQYYLSILPELRFHPGNKTQEKYLIRQAFSRERFINSENKPLLPPEILWRRKEAFSDGVTGQTRSLYQILGDHAETLKMPQLYGVLHNPPKTAEQNWYRQMFEESYMGSGELVPYFWMPRYVDANDASARTLKLYSE